MATETLIFQIDATPTVKALQDIGKEIEKNTDALKSYEKGTEAYIVQEASVKVLQKEQRALTNVLVQQKAAIDRVSDATVENIKVGKASENSIEQNRKAYNALYNQLIRTAKPTADQIAITKELNQVLKQQEAALGNTSRNVGNYAEGFKEAAKDLNIFGVNVGGLSKGLDAAKMGFESAGGGVKGFGAALATTGLPLFIMGMQSLLTVFENFKPVADAVEDSVTALGATFRAIVTGGDIDSIVNSSMELLNVMRDLEDTQDAFNLSQKRLRGESEALLVASKDRTKSEQERLALIAQAEQLERDVFGKALVRNVQLEESQRKALKAKLEISDAELKLLAEQTSVQSLALRKRLEEQKGLTDEEIKNYQATLIALADLDADRNKFTEKRINERNKIIEKAEAEREKAEAERLKLQDKRDAEEAKRVEKLIADKQKEKDALLKIEDEYNKELEQQADDKFKTDAKRMADEAKAFEESELAQAARLKKYQDAKAKEVDLAKKAADEKYEILQAELGAARSISGSIIGLIQQVAEANGAGAEFAKSLGLIQILTSQGIALAQGVASASALPFPLNLGAIAGVIGTITGLIGSIISNFQSTPEVPPIPAFATGVIGLDGAGTATSDSIDARLSRGESVITAKATERFAPVLAQMELAVGNRPNFQLGNRKFATGYIPTTDGGYSDRAMSSDVNKANDLAKMFSDTIAKMPQPKLVYDEFTKFVDNRNQSVNLSEL